jgi:hypothetical protein
LLHEIVDLSPLAGLLPTVLSIFFVELIHALLYFALYIFFLLCYGLLLDCEVFPLLYHRLKHLLHLILLLLHELLAVGFGLLRINLRQFLPLLFFLFLLLLLLLLDSLLDRFVPPEAPHVIDPLLDGLFGFARGHRLLFLIELLTDLFLFLLSLFNLLDLNELILKLLVSLLANILTIDLEFLFLASICVLLLLGLIPDLARSAISTGR